VLYYFFDVAVDYNCILAGDDNIVMRLGEEENSDDDLINTFYFHAGLYSDTVLW